MEKNMHNLWVRWTVANALSELLGLGATFGLIAFLVSSLNPQSLTGILLTFAVSVLSGTVEATMVGVAQWWAMHPWFPMIRALRWWRATLIGALAAYALGYLPTTLIDMGGSGAQTPQPEPAIWLTMLFAVGLGMVAGAILSFAQWLELRKHLKKATLWMPANMLAWACGMPVIFLGIDFAFKMTELWQQVIVMGAVLLGTGTIVGAIQGKFLLEMANERRESVSAPARP